MEPFGRMSVCSVTCGGGFKQRQRYCDNPAPDPDGKSCTGEDAQNGTCSENACPGSMRYNIIMYLTDYSFHKFSYDPYSNFNI